ncbi:F-box protein [Hibiscus syriacus]|uniref:F-box protein n=1 Tax=Hibiscus syriacus TaxID=106335 RepID=A0A6A2ZFN5_HIBSY|nr:F-box protein [Hibiscus syriacus]
MNPRTWPDRSDASRFNAFTSSKPDGRQGRTNRPRSTKFGLKPSSSPSSQAGDRDFSALPFDILTRIAAPFNFPNVLAASLVCRSWRDALRPLREATVLLRHGKRLKHGRCGARRNLEKALDSFLKGAELGSTLAMVDAGLIYWEKGQKKEAIAFNQRAAAFGDTAGQCNLGTLYLQGDPQDHKEAIKWLHQASIRAMFELSTSWPFAWIRARWYLEAAEGGYVRAMYNASICFTFGEGLSHNRRQARKWMKRAADRGHGKAQFEHGLTLASEGEMMKAVVYLELAIRSGETAATRVKNVILGQLSGRSRDLLADNWRAFTSYPPRLFTKLSRIIQ